MTMIPYLDADAARVRGDDDVGILLPAVQADVDQALMHGARQPGDDHRLFRVSRHVAVGQMDPRSSLLIVGNEVIQDLGQRPRGLGHDDVPAEHFGAPRARAAELRGVAGIAVPGHRQPVHRRVMHHARVLPHGLVLGSRRGVGHRVPLQRVGIGVQSRRDRPDHGRAEDRRAQRTALDHGEDQVLAQVASSGQRQRSAVNRDQAHRGRPRPCAGRQARTERAQPDERLRHVQGTGVVSSHRPGGSQAEDREQAAQGYDPDGRPLSVQEPDDPSRRQPEEHGKARDKPGGITRSRDGESHGYLQARGPDEAGRGLPQAEINDLGRLAASATGTGGRGEQAITPSLRVPSVDLASRMRTNSTTRDPATATAINPQHRCGSLSGGPAQPLLRVRITRAQNTALSPGPRTAATYQGRVAAAPPVESFNLRYAQSLPVSLMRQPALCSRREQHDHAQPVTRETELTCQPTAGDNEEHGRAWYWTARK